MMRNILYLSILLLLASCSVSRIGYIYKSIDDNPVVVFENDDCHAALQFFLDFDDVVKIDNEPVENALKSGYTVTTGPGNWKVYNEKVDVNYFNYHIVIYPGTKIRKSHCRMSDWSSSGNASGSYVYGYNIEVVGYLKMTKINKP